MDPWRFWSLTALTLRQFFVNIGTTVLRLVKTEEIRQYQGSHELDVSLGGEADLQRNLLMCMKNPGHDGFISVKDFGIQHLPENYQRDLIVDFIRAYADLTVRVSVRGVSRNRPRLFPGSNKRFPYYKQRGREDMLITGSGWISTVCIFSEDEGRICECRECQMSPNKAKRTWGQVSIRTSCHVVFDDVEAAQTICHLFYDDSNSHLNKAVSLRRFKVLHRDMQADYCVLGYATHDTNLLYQLDKLWNRCAGLQTKLFRYKQHVTCDRLAICISHPHGCSKQISVGKWIERDVLREQSCRLYDGKMIEGVWTQYTYTAPTCPGSSGAPVISPVFEGELWAGLYHPHCEGHLGNINVSGFYWEPVSFRKRKNGSKRRRRQRGRRRKWRQRKKRRNRN